MFEVLMREHVLKKVTLFDLPTGSEYAKRTKKRSYGQAAGMDCDGILTSRISDTIRGHTSFLVFANFYPSPEA